MRTLALNEIEQVGGGVLPFAVVPLIKAAAPIVATVVTAATTIIGGMAVASSINRAIDKAAEACKDGSEATVKSPIVEMSCSPKADVQPASRHPQRTPPPGVLQAMMPQYVGA
jgi:hypothetical protein